MWGLEGGEEEGEGGLVFSFLLLLFDRPMSRESRRFGGMQLLLFLLPSSSADNAIFIQFFLSLNLMGRPASVNAKTDRQRNSPWPCRPLASSRRRFAAGAAAAPADSSADTAAAAASRCCQCAHPRRRNLNRACPSR